MTLTCKLLAGVRILTVSLMLYMSGTAFAQVTQIEDSLQAQVIASNERVAELRERVSNVEGRIAGFGAAISILQVIQVIFQLREHRRKT
jgi:hypothetical protein